MFYDKFIELCEKSHISPSKAAAEIGFDRSSVTKWKNGGFTPRQEILVKTAEYFKVTVDYLIGNDTAESREDAIKFALFGGDAKYISDEAYEDVKRFAQFVAEKERRKSKDVKK